MDGWVKIKKLFNNHKIDVPGLGEQLLLGRDPTDVEMETETQTQTEMIASKARGVLCSKLLGGVKFGWGFHPDVALGVRVFRILGLSDTPYWITRALQLDWIVNNEQGRGNPVVLTVWC